MTTPTQPVTCRFFEQDGNPIAAKVSFKLTSQEIYNGIVVGQQADYVLCDPLTGIGVINLFPNALGVNGSQYTVRAWDSVSGRSLLGKDTFCSIPDSPCFLDMILNQDAFPVLDASQQALAATQAQVYVSLGHATLAGDYKDAAEVSAAQALTRSTAAALSEYNASMSEAAADASKVTVQAVATAFGDVQGAITAASGSAAAALVSANNADISEANALASANLAVQNSTNLAASSGASLVGYLGSGAGVIATTIQAKLRESVSVMQFGADPTGVASSSTAITAAQTYLASIGGGTLLFPPGEYRVTTPIEMKPGITYKGPMKAGLGEYNPNRSRIFSSTGNVFVNSTTTITEVCFRDLFIESIVGGGHIFDWSAAGVVAKIEMEGVCLAQRNTAKCVIYGAAAGGVFSIWMHDFEFVYVPNCTYPQIWINSPTVNSIFIENFWSTANGESAAGNPAILVESTNPAGAAFNVAIRRGVFELSGSGCVALRSCSNSVIEDCTTYDLSIAPGYYQFSVDKNAASVPSSNVSIRGCRSTVGTVAYADLFLNTSVAGQGAFSVESCTFSYVDGTTTSSGGYVEILNSSITYTNNLSFTAINGGPESNLRFANTDALGSDVSFWNGYPGNKNGALNIKVNGIHSGSFDKAGNFNWGTTYIQRNGLVQAGSRIYPATPQNTYQTTASLVAGNGTPTDGINGDFYFRGDGGAGTSIYMKRGGVWVGIV